MGHIEGKVRDPSTREGSGVSRLGPISNWSDMIFLALGQQIIRREGTGSPVAGLMSLVGRGLGYPNSKARDHME